MLSSRRLAYAAATLLLLGTRSLAAQGTPDNHLYDKFQLDLSGTAIRLSSNFRVDGDSTGTEVNGETVLGLNTVKFQPRASLRWRPGKRHELELGYQFARRKGDKTLAQDFVFDDSTFSAGLRVKSTFNTDQAFLTYRYAFLAHERTQVGIGVGLGAFFYKIELDALASLSGSGGADSVQFVKSKSFVGPIGSLGLYGRFLSGEHWYFEADARGLVIKIDPIKATVFDAGGAVRYYVSRTVGLEAGYGFTGVQVTITRKRASSGDQIQSGKIKYNLQNIRLGVVISL